MYIEVYINAKAIQCFVYFISDLFLAVTAMTLQEITALSNASLHF